MSFFAIPCCEATVKLMSGEMILVTGAFEYIHPPTVDTLQPAFGTLEGEQLYGYMEQDSLG